MKTAYLYDSVTLLYSGEREVSLISGYEDYIKPRFSTWESLPSYDQSTQRCKFSNNAWSVEQIPEITVYHSVTGDELIILEGKEIPNGYQENQPEPMTQEELNEYKEVKKDALREDCRVSIESLISSYALGASNTYDCRGIDQHNLKMLVLAGNGGEVYTHDGTEFVWQPHTHDQCLALLQDMNAHIKTNRDKLYTLISQVNAATTKDEIYAISW